MIPLLLAVAAGALAQAPLRAGGPVKDALLALPLDGAPALVASAGDALVAYRLDGRPLPGFPVPLGEPGGAPAAADVDGDGRPELGVATASGKVFLVGRAGPLPGFPVRLGAPVRAGVSFADVDGDGRPELLVGDEQGRLHALGRGGAPAPGWPLALGAAVTSSASSGRLAGGATLAVGCADGKVHAIALPARKERRGFPLVTGYEVSGAPAFADLDEDGALDLVVASQDFAVHAVSGAGEPLAGWPVHADFRIYGGAALADLDADGAVDVAVAAADGAVHAFSARGRPLAGFPVRTGGRFLSAAVAGDVDGDGRPEVVALAEDGALVAVGAGGSPAGWPRQLGAAEATAAPALVEAEGGLVVAAGLPSGELHLARAAGRGAPPPWPLAGRDAARGARLLGNAARLVDLALEPAAPRAGEPLRASWKVLSADLEPGAAPPAPAVEWRRDGAPVPELRGRREVPAGTTRKGERWSFALGGAATPALPEVRIGNSRPGAARVALDPAQPALGSPVRLRVLQPASDPDGERLEQRVEWLLDGVPVEGAHGEVFPAERLRRGATLAVRVTALDADGEGPPATAEALVAGAPPPAWPVKLAPAAPRRGEAIVAQSPPPPAGPGGEPLALRYRWSVAGEPANLPLSAASLAPRAFRKHQRVRVEVRAFDGAQEGPPTAAEVEVPNAPPSAPVVEIRPAAPRRGEPLRAVVVAPSIDPDDDPVAYRFAWRRNGEPVAVPGDGRELPGAALRKGDRVELTAVASDGEAEGPPARAEARVGNSPPGSARIALEPASPRGGQPLRVVYLERAADPDGDPVVHAVSWTRDGKPLPAAGEALPAELVRKGSRVQATVVARDGEAAGPPAVAEVRAGNAPPGAPEIALEPARPLAGAPLRARLVRPAPDPDGDAPSHRWRWLRDGFPVPVPDARPASRKEPYWTTATELPAGEARKGERWTVEAQAFDGDAHGAVARAEVRIGNTPPPPPRLAVVPDPPRASEPVRLAVTQPPDPDGDRVTHRHAWFRNGAPAGLPPSQAELPRGAVKKGERWRVEVVASDGEADSAPASLELRGGNSPPGPIAISLCDAPVPSDAPLVATIRDAGSDPDGDPLVHRFSWFVNGKPLGQTAKGMPRLSGQGLGRGDVVRVVAEAFDGSEAGPQTAAECQLANSPPTAPEVAIEPAAPTFETGLRAVVRAPAADRDGDALTYRITWLRDGQPTAVDQPQVPPKLPRRGETWTVLVRAFDGEAEGPAVVASARVGNVRPPKPALTAPASITGGQPIPCQARAADRDAEGDRLELRFRWLRDGEPSPIADGRPELPPGVARRGERWTCEAWTSDGEGESERTRAIVAVRNLAPREPKVVIEPERPRRGDALACRLAAEAEDADGDRVRYAYAWWRDGAPVPVPEPGWQLPPDLARKGERWRCAATPSDGEATGAPGRAEVRIGNTPPSAPRVALSPAAPVAGEPLRCELAAPAVDPDGDGVRHAFAWFRNGEEQAFAASAAEVPARLVREGDRWRCAAAGSDGEAAGPPGTSLESTVRAPLRAAAP